ncbi:MAG: lactonase family protein [Chthoniobacterales bacterium]
MSLASFSDAAELRIYLGCEKTPASPAGIFLSALNTETGALQPPKRVATADNPSFIAIKDDHLYSVSEGKTGAVVSWSVGSDGSLTRLNEQSTGGEGPCHVSISPSGRVLFAANYSSGSLAAFPLEKDGSIGARSAFIQLTGSGPNPKRQTSPHAHGIYCDPAEKFVYVTDLGTDRVWIYRLNADDATLIPLEPGTLPPGSGPRHLAFAGNRIYVNGEMGLGVTLLQRDADTGTLQTGPTTAAFPSGMEVPSNADTAEVVVHPNGKFLYLSTRGYSSFSSFAIAPDGLLTLLQNIPSPVQGPRHFSLSPDGRWLIAAGQRDHRAAVCSIDPATGKIQPPEHAIEVPGPVCAIFAP